MKLKYGKKPLSYNWNHLNQSEEPLRSIYFQMYGLNEMLGYFEGEVAKGDTYGYYHITNNALICYQSLEKAINAKSYNLLHILSRQSSDLRYNTELLFNEIEKTDLGKIRIKERLKSYSAYCLWNSLNRWEKLMNKDAHYFDDGSTPYSKEEINEFTRESSVEFHRIKDQISQLELASQVSHLNKRQREGASLYTFAEVIDPKYKSTSSFIRKSYLPVTKSLYSIASDRLHGTWISSGAHEDNQIVCEQLTCTDIEFELVINHIHENMDRIVIALFNMFEFLWPVLLKSANAKRWEEIKRTGK